jgi:hypothetical protein
VILVERIAVRRLGDPGETAFNRSSYVGLLNHPGHGAFVLFSSFTNRKSDSQGG